MCNASGAGVRQLSQRHGRADKVKRCDGDGLAKSHGGHVLGSLEDLILISLIPDPRLRGADLRHRAGHVGFASPRGMALIAAETRELLCSPSTS